MVIANVLYRPVTNIITLKWLETHNNLTAKLASIKVLISTPLKKDQWLIYFTSFYSLPSLTCRLKDLHMSHASNTPSPLNLATDIGGEFVCCMSLSLSRINSLSLGYSSNLLARPRTRERILNDVGAVYSVHTVYSVQCTYSV